MKCPFRNFAPCLQGECAAYEPEGKVGSFTIPERCNMFLPYTVGNAVMEDAGKTWKALCRMGANAHGGENPELLYGSSPCINLPKRKESGK